MKANSSHITRKRSHFAILILALVFPTLAATARADTIYVADSGNNVIYRYSPDGSRSVFASTGLSRPQGLVFDTAGNLFVANYGNNTIARFTPGGAVSTFASTGLSGPAGLAFDSSGNLYAANQINSTIMRFTPEGVGSLFASGGFLYPGGLAIDHAGNVFVTADSAMGHAIVSFTPAGVESIFASGLSQPTLLAFDSAGNLYAGSYGYSRIDRFTPDGVRSTFAEGQNYPYGMAFDSAGDLYVANVYGGTVQRIKPDGASSVFAAGLSGGPTGVAIIPEPPTWTLLTLLLPALLCLRHRARNWKLCAQVQRRWQETAWLRSGAVACGGDCFLATKTGPPISVFSSGVGC